MLLITRRLLCGLVGGLCVAAPGSYSEEGVEVQALRERLTEREDENRNPDPFEVPLFGRPLILNGQYEMAVDAIDQLSLSTPNRTGEADAEEGEDDASEPSEPLLDLPGQTLFEQELELEMFYPRSESFSLFGQVRLIHEEDLDADTIDGISDVYVERGEMWLFCEEPFDLPFTLELGRLDFEDDRLWWWDEDLDAVRVIHEAETWEIALAVARELAPRRSDRSFIDPEEEEIQRYFVEASWDWSEEHAIEFYSLMHRDQSRTESVESTLALDREDESDADLDWIGLRASGAIEFEGGGLIGYWADVGTVDGDETLVETESTDAGQLEVVDVQPQAVEGWAFDLGVTCLLPWAAEPRLTLGYARTSGDRNPDDHRDEGFRQTGLHGNEPGYGGVQRFQGYGELLDPELSNLSVLTVGFGCSLLESSSIDVAFHDYRLAERSDALREARIDTALTGVDRELGQELDVILGLEEWERFEIECRAAAFRAGKAFGVSDGKWIYSGYIALRYAF